MTCRAALYASSASGGWARVGWLDDPVVGIGAHGGVARILSLNGRSWSVELCQAPPRAGFVRTRGGDGIELWDSREVDLDRDGRQMAKLSVGRPGAVEAIARMLRDVRSLGRDAPLRAGYEFSKRAGGHSLVFGRLARTPLAVREGVSPFVVRAVPDAVRHRTLGAADEIVDGTIELFGTKLRLGDPPDWSAVIHTEGSWPSTEWWRLDLRSQDRVGDVKWAWELGRHRHLVLLARAAHLDPGNDTYMACLERHLESWMDACPPEHGVHWSSNLEIALRALSWLQILAFTDSRLDPSLRMSMWRHLDHAARHLVADLVYTKSTMRNNHLLGDALGLIALGTAFGSEDGDRWRSTGNHLFDSQLARQVHPDGSMIEDSVSYQRFVLEMLSMRILLGDAGEHVRRAMSNVAAFLTRLGALDGEVPQFGDWDEGRVFAVSDDPTRLAGSVRLALALGGSGAPTPWRTSDDEVAWFAGKGVPEEPDILEIGGADIGGGVARAQAGPFTVWLKAGTGPSHGHADLTSVAIMHSRRWLTGDPGTGTYNGSSSVRTYFRSSLSHNVVRVDGEDQLVPHRVFRWRHQATGAVGDPVSIHDQTIMWAVHTAYTRCSPSRRVARIVVVGRDGVDVADFVEGAEVAVDLSVPLHPDAVWNGSGSLICVGDEIFDLVLPAGDVRTVSGCNDPYAGWWSETYGSTTPSELILVHGSSGSSIRWGIHRRGTGHGDEDRSDRQMFEIAVVFDAASVHLDITTVDGDRVRRTI